MKANELRIGNLVNEPINIDFKIRQENLCDFANGFITLKPIPLTEKWLIKFGFEKSNKITFSKDLFVLIYHKNSKTFVFPYFSGRQTLVEIESVHQLQNIYFALIGEELQCN